MTNRIPAMAGGGDGTGAQDVPRAGNAPPGGVAPFLALLAALGDSPSPEATASTLVGMAPAETGRDGPPSATGPGTQSTARMRRQRGDDKHAQQGIEHGLPVLPGWPPPAPIMMATPPALTQHGPGDAPPPKGQGRVTAHPILGSSANLTATLPFVGSDSHPAQQDHLSAFAGGYGQATQDVAAGDLPPGDVAATPANLVLAATNPTHGSGIANQPAPLVGATDQGHALLAQVAALATMPRAASTARRTSEPAGTIAPPAPANTVASDPSPSSGIMVAHNTPAGAPGTDLLLAPSLPASAGAMANGGTQTGASIPVAQGMPEAVAAAGDLGVVAPRRTSARTTDASMPIFAAPGTGMVAGRMQLAGSNAASVHPAVATATQRIVAEARLLQNGAATEMRLRLRPPDLGDVQVVLRRDHAGDLAVHLIPATREAAAALDAHLHHLRDALDAQSANHHAEVTLRRFDDAPSHQHQGRQQTATGDDATDVTLATTPSNPAVSATPGRTRLARSALDYDA